MIGIAKRDNIIDVSLLEFCVREDLNKTTPRVMAVMNPLKVVIVNYPENSVEELDAVNNPEDESMGSRKVPFSREIYIERDDFMENPPKKYFRLAIGQEVRLRYAYFIKCVDVIKNTLGEITEVHCTYDEASRGGKSPDGRKVQGTIHWVSVEQAVKAEIRLYDRLFVKEEPEEVEEGMDFTSNLNPASLSIITGYLEPSLKNSPVGTKYQFERVGYFCTDYDSGNEKLIFNRTVQLKDSWAKVEKKQ